MDYLSLYQQYLEFDPSKSKPDGFTPCKCPFHEDRNASAGVNLTSGVFHCFSCSLSLSVTKFISRVSNKTMPEALLIVDSFRQANGIKQVENNFSNKFIYVEEQSEWRDLYLKSKRTILDETFAVEYCSERGFPLDVLKSFDVGFLTKEDLNSKSISPKWAESCPDGCMVIPYFYSGKIVGLRFRSIDGKKSGLEKSLYIPFGLDRIPEICPTLIVVEGESDFFRLTWEFRKRGIDIPVISTPGTAYKVEWERDLTDIGQIIIIPDSDSAGQEMVKNWEKHKGLVTVCDLQWKRKQLGKDLCEWFAQNDIDYFVDNLIELTKLNNISNLVEDTDDFLTDKEDDDHSINYITKFINAGQIGIIGGAQKSKKTWICLNLVRSLLTPGSYFLGIDDFVSSETVPNILYVQTEGSKSKFKDRIRKVLKDCDYTDRAKWSFKPSIKLDEPKDVTKLIKMVKDKDIGVLILDPFQRLHSQDEDSSTQTGPVWDALFKVLNSQDKLCILVVHHFSKEGDINQTWKALRGSSRMAGEVDFGMFVANDVQKDYEGIKLTFDFRDEERLTDDGKSVFRAFFDAETGLFSKVVEKEPLVNFTTQLEKYIQEKGETKFMDLVKHFSISEPTLTKHVERSPLLEKTKPAAGKPACVKLVRK